MAARKKAGQAKTEDEATAATATESKDPPASDETPPAAWLDKEGEGTDPDAKTQGLLDVFDGDRSVVDLQDFVRIPKLRIVQEQTPTKPWPVGSVFMHPKDVLVAEAGDTAPIVPLVMFPKWIAWNDRSDTRARAVEAESFDPSSDLARRARHHNDRVEKYGHDDRFTREYVEHLVFVAVIYAGEHAGEVVSFEFSRGDYERGRDLCDAIASVSLEGRQVPMWSQVWELSAEHVERPKGACWLLRLEHATLVEVDEAKALRQRHEQLAAQHRQRILRMAE